MSVANVYNQPGSSSEYFTLANNTHTILASYLGKCKIGVETDTGYLGYTDQTGYYRSINPNVTAGVTLPTNLSGYLNNDGAGNMSWKTPAGSGGVTLPTGALGFLHNDGSNNMDWRGASGSGATLPSNKIGFLYDDGVGNNDWRLPTPSQIGAAPSLHATQHVTGGTDVIALVVAAGNAGLMGGTDKTKLDGIASNATYTPLSSATPLPVTIGGAGNQGSGTAASRNDHLHNIAPFGSTPGTICQGSDKRLVLVNTRANWTSANTVLGAGQIGYESDTERFKIGDGTTAWNSLYYYECTTRAVSTSGTITFSDDMISATATCTLTLPATAASGKFITIKNFASTFNTPCVVTINCTGGDKIDSNATMVLDNIYDWVTLRDDPNTGNWTIVAQNSTQHTHIIYNMGDSLSAGGQMDTRLQVDLGNAWTYNDLGIGGSRTSDMVSRMTAVTGPGDAEYLMFWGGVNDCLASVASATIIANIQSICTTAHNAGIKVICCTISPCSNYSGWSSGIQTILAAVNTAIKTTITNIDYIIDLYQTLGAGNTYIQAGYDSGDGLHPNTTGYQACADAIYAGTTWTYQRTALYQIGLSNNINLNQNLRTTDNVQFQAIDGSNGQLALNCITGNPVAIGSTGLNILNSPATVANYQLNVFPKNTIGGMIVSASNGQTGAWITTDTGIVLVLWATDKMGTAIESCGTNHFDSPPQRAIGSGFSWNIANNKIVECRRLGLNTGTAVKIATGGRLYLQPII
jgi:lysophospholipase L1-like esterase